ncbi:acyclic terpene utilization AtuA family protein, partial [Porticoccaceae bacterium]|nr:acyclic terpene utilization AtuA family protein [Porticoccaceae bacterium]
EVESLETIGYPIAEVRADGSFDCSKPKGTGGLVNRATIAEQMVYEIGDPQAYMLPDVVCDFSNVELEQLAENLVRVTGATGLPAPDTYKVCTTYADEFRGGTNMTFYGVDADRKAQKLADAIFTASRRTLKQLGLADFSETSVELIGAESQYGSNAQISQCRELVMKIAAKHPDAAGIGIMLKESVGLGLATPPGLSGFAGARPSPSPVVRLFSFALPKGTAKIQVEMDGAVMDVPDTQGVALNRAALSRPDMPASPTDATVSVPLIKLAWARSGDKGDKANIGVIARKPEYLPYIYAALTEQAVADRFGHFLPAGATAVSQTYVERYLMPGTDAINFLIHDVLGGGGMASIRNDAQGKGYGQLMLDAAIPVSAAIASQLK